MRPLLIFVGIVGLAAGGMALLNANSAGFPDGYISPYDRSTGVLVYALAYGLLLAGLFTMVAAIMRKPRRAIVGAVILALGWAALGIVENCWSLGWCPPIYEQLTGTMFDDGQGG